MSSDLPIELDAELRRGLRLAISSAVRQRVRYVETGPYDRSFEADPRRREDLTDKEIEVLARWACGDSNADVAARLCKAPGTIKNQALSILRKLGARNRAHALAIVLVGDYDGWRLVPAGEVDDDA